MSNTRTKRPKNGRVRAPQDSMSFEEGQAERPRLRKGRLVLVGLKVFVGFTLLCTAALGLAYGVHRYARTTPRFSVKNVEIEGTKRLMRDDVLAVAKIQRGQNLFSLDIEGAEKALVESPWIASARVTRRLPGTVKLTLVERDPKAIAVISGKTFLLAMDGTPFKELGRGDPHDLPVITGISPENLARDRRAEQERIVDVLGLLQAYEKSPLSKSLPAQEAHVSDTGSVTLTVGERGTTLHLGQGPFKQKLLRAERVLEKTRRAGGTPEVLFLDNEAHPERVVVRVQ